ncbi:hypothetical protein SAMD00023353_2300040 [Rosellinia necatrix]|uniref:Uncharacterized protein n=1 Tax=Rosellinia necatrix TaxID=77044 RepID=A0A1S8A8A5_ROSNE|nr:hypothetical protein SAMD00023353_2300040 [Rosellinia necatrix]
MRGGWEGSPKYVRYFGSHISTVISLPPSHGIVGEDGGGLDTLRTCIYTRESLPKTYGQCKVKSNIARAGMFCIGAVAQDRPRGPRRVPAAPWFWTLDNRRRALSRSMTVHNDGSWLRVPWYRVYNLD